MLKDKFSAIWVSHSSLSDYLKCPRGYYLKNIWKNPKTNHKCSIVSPALALGQSVHEVLEALSTVPAESRFSSSLLEMYDHAWKKVSGLQGGFTSQDQEQATKLRGQNMLQRVVDHPGPLLHKAIKIRQDLPYFWLSDEDNIILCGKIDWLEYQPESDTVNILDFKTGKYDENPDSLQLPIYLLLVKNCQTHAVSGASYWYLDRDDSPRAVALPESEVSRKKVLDLAKKVALARKLNHFVCPQITGCRFCRDLEKVYKGEAHYVGVNDFGQDLYSVS
jgi:CRISPR/Cas system-associated exonuclease Cas4 (RecB family)